MNRMNRMNRKQTLYALGIVCICIGIANLTALITTTPKPQIANLTWNIPNITIVNNTIVYSYITGIIPKLNPDTGQIEVTSTTPLQPEMNQTIGNTTIITYYDNITQFKGTVNWLIWNTTTDRIETYPVENHYWKATWKGATIGNRTYNTTLKSYAEYQKEIFKLIPEIQIEITRKRKPAATIPALLAITIGTAGIIGGRTCSNQKLTT